MPSPTCPYAPPWAYQTDTLVRYGCASASSSCPPQSSPSRSRRSCGSSISPSHRRSANSKGLTPRSRCRWTRRQWDHWLSLDESSAWHKQTRRHGLLKRWYELLLIFPIASSQCVTYKAKLTRYTAERRVRVATTPYLETRLLLQSLDLPTNVIAVIAKTTQSIPSAQRVRGATRRS